MGASGEDSGSMPTERSAAIWAKVFSVFQRVASLRVKSCHLLTITSQYAGSISISLARLAVFSQAITVDPDPAKGSSTKSPRLLLFRIARYTRPTGFIGGRMWLA